MSKYCLFLIVIYYLTGGNNSMSRFCKFGKLHVTKGNVDKLLGILLTASKELKRSLAISLISNWLVIGDPRGPLFYFKNFFTKRFTSIKLAQSITGSTSSRGPVKRRPVLERPQMCIRDRPWPVHVFSSPA